MKWISIGATLLVAVLSARSGPAQTNAVVTLEARQTDVMPRGNVLYRLAPGGLYRTSEPGPKESGTSRAWALANEFVFRTALRDRCALPASSAIPHKTGVMVLFGNKEGAKRVGVFVRSDMQTIECKEAGGGGGPWQARAYADNEAVARVLYEEQARLRAGKLAPAELIPSLRDQRELFRDDDGATITVRDLAFAMLEEAGLARMPVASTRTKLICGCEVKGEWYRFHVPALSDRDFEAVIEALQTARAGEGKSRGK